MKNIKNKNPEKVKPIRKIVSDFGDLLDLTTDEIRDLQMSREAPTEFDIITGELPTTCKCPKCGYTW